MTYSINIINRERCHLIQQNGEGKEIIKDITLKTFFETAQRLGFISGASYMEEDSCIITFDFYGVEKSVHRTYASMLEADCFGTEDLETIIKSFFDTFPEKVYWIKAHAIEVLHRTPQRDCDGKYWRLYTTTTGTENHLHRGFIDTEWSEYQTNQRTALEMLLKQLQGQVIFIKAQLEMQSHAANFLSEIKPLPKS